MKHLMIDGIGGSGKTTIVRAFVEHLKQQGKSVFILEDFEKQHHALPQEHDWEHADVLWIAEPTKSWTGSAIRGELLRKDLPYDPKLVAIAFAVDRAALYTRIVLPARNRGKIILHERGVYTSIAYQGAMPGGYSRDAIAQLPGNSLALAHPPEILIVCDPGGVDAGLERLAIRNDHRLGVAGERELLQAAHTWFTETAPTYFAQTSCTYRILSTALPKEDAISQGITLFSSLL